MTPAVKAAVAFGSNLGDRAAHIERALTHLEGHAAIRVERRSRLYETEPVGGPPQGRFLNGAVVLATTLGPRELLEVLRAAEAAGGRTRDVPDGPRTIDLDLVFFGDRIVEEPDLHVPHPRAHERLFVLEPLAEVAPDWVHPTLGRTVRDLLAERGARMQEFAAPAALRAAVHGWRARGRTIGLVPTMGALHAGHLSLVEAARRECDVVVVSIFVNPLQFGAGEDLGRYPRTLDSDRAQLAAAAVDALFLPAAGSMYPPCFQTHVEPGELGEPLCGASRPGHFRGVATVVAKLFHLAAPHVAFFGQKDYQQARVLQKMVLDLDFDLRLRILPTVREADGLALSSRNVFLTREERHEAPRLHAALQAVERAFDAGERRTEALREAGLRTLSLRRFEVDYFDVRDDETLRTVERLDDAGVAAAALRGSARLIDNVLLGAARRRLG